MKSSRNHIVNIISFCTLLTKRLNIYIYIFAYCTIISCDCNQASSNAYVYHNVSPFKFERYKLFTLKLRASKNGPKTVWKSLKTLPSVIYNVYIMCVWPADSWRACDATTIENCCQFLRFIVTFSFIYLCVVICLLRAASTEQWKNRTEFNIISYWFLDIFYFEFLFKDPKLF